MSRTSEFPITGILKNIKQHLDPAYTYLFFEMVDQSESTEAFSHALSCLKESPVKKNYWQLYRDANTGLLFLMVKLHPACEEQFIQYVLARGIDRGFKFSWFKTRSIV